MPLQSYKVQTRKVSTYLLGGLKVGEGTAAFSCGAEGGCRLGEAVQVTRCVSVVSWSLTLMVFAILSGGGVTGSYRYTPYQVRYGNNNVPVIMHN